MVIMPPSVTISINHFSTRHRKVEISVSLDKSTVAALVIEERETS